MYGVIVREKKILLIVGILDAAAGGIFLILSVSDSLRKRDFVQMFFCCIVFGMMFLLGVWMLMSYLLRRLCLGYGECYYQTMFGRRTGFLLHDIKKVERRVRFGEMTIILWGENGKRLARVETNMEDAGKILPFLKEYRLPAVEEDVAWREKETWEKMQETYEVYKKSRYYPERQRNYRKVLEEEWKEAPALYQLPGEISQIRLRARILDVVGVVMAVFFWRMSGEAAAGGFVVYPLIIFGFYFEYPRVLVWDVNTRNKERKKKEYVEMPAVGLAFILLCGMLKITGINIEETWKAVVFGTALLAISIGLLLLFYKKRRIAELGIPIFILCFYCYIGVFYWNCLFCVGETEHIQAEVVEKQESGGGSSVHSYHLILRTRDGEDRKAEVVYGMYDRTNSKDTVIICRRTSRFGIHYYYVHS